MKKKTHVNQTWKLKNEQFFNTMALAMVALIVKTEKQTIHLGPPILGATLRSCSKVSLITV